MPDISDNNTAPAMDNAEPKANDAVSDAVSAADPASAASQVEVPNAEADKPASKDIDLAEIDAYLKTLVPGLLGMSENLVALGEKFQDMNRSLGRRINEVDTNILRYDSLIVKKNKLILITLVGSVGAVLLSLTMMFVAGYNYSAQVNSMNALSVSLARRLSEVNSGLVTFEQINQSITNLGNRVERMQLIAENQSDTLRDTTADIRAQLGLTGIQVDESLLRWQGTMTSALNGVALENRTASSNILRSVEQLDAGQRRLMDTTPTLRELVELKDQVTALIVLERNRYLEAISAAQALARESSETPPEQPEVDTPLQYRRVTQ
jgi:hypothetical protein